MNSTASNPNAASIKGLGYAEQYQAQVKPYMAKQLSIVRGLHYVLQGLFLLCIVLACIMFVVAIYYTFVWIFTGALTKLDDAWVNFGLSMSFLVFPWGLDVMLLRAFPTEILPGWRKPSQPINLRTGVGAFFAGLGIMCAGAPGAARMIELATRAVR